jgi:hypothetical protein
MKTSRLLLLAGLLAGAASLLTAGPGPQFWNRQTAQQPASTAVAAATPTQSAMPAMACTAMPACACCKKA